MKKAFTLIEVMVVLSILAIIAILAYNFFGSTMKTAKTNQLATQIIKDLNIVADATEKFEIAYYEGRLSHVQPWTMADNITGGANRLEVSLMDNSIIDIIGLREFPSPPEDAKDTGYLGTAIYQDYYYLSNYDDYNTDGNADLTIITDGIKEDVCAAINKIATGDPTIYTTTTTDWSAVPSIRPVGCYSYDITGTATYFPAITFRLYPNWE